MKTEHIIVFGFIGTWYVIDTKIYFGTTLYLLEHETYGDDTSSIIIDENYNVICDEAWNGFQDYEESSVYELSKTLNMVVTQIEYAQVHWDWKAFSENPSAYAPVVAKMIKNDILERREEYAEQCSSNTEN